MLWLSARLSLKESEENERADHEDEVSKRNLLLLKLPRTLIIIEEITSEFNIV